MNLLRTPLKILQSLKTPKQTTVFSSREFRVVDPNAASFLGEPNPLDPNSPKVLDIKNIPVPGLDVAPPPSKDVVVSPLFKSVLIFVMVLVVLSLAGAVVISFQKTPTELQKNLYSVLTGIATTSVTAVIALLAGKSI
jgi:hypothetical protein